MDKRLSQLLERDEKLLWSGSPERFETLDKTNKNSILIGSALKLLVTLGIVIAYLYATRSTAGIKPGLLLILLAAGGMALANPFIVAGRLRNNTIYGLTDRRILRAGSCEEGVPYERIKRAVLRSDADGHMTLLCGPRATELKPAQWRIEADASIINGSSDPECDRLILYALPMDAELKSLLEEKLPILQ